MHAKHNEERRQKASDILSSNGYGKMSGMVKKGISEHEAHDHKGEKKTRVKLATGGAAKGEAPKARMDRQPRKAGGRNMKGHKEPHVSVNVINAGQKPSMPMPGAAPMAPHPAVAPPPVMAGAPSPMAPHPGMPPAAPMGPPGGMPPGARPFKAGGPVKNSMDMPHLTAGSGSGLGRLEKAKHEKSRKKAA